MICLQWNVPRCEDRFQVFFGTSQEQARRRFFARPMAAMTAASMPPIHGPHTMGMITPASNPRVMMRAFDNGSPGNLLNCGSHD
jgi:hypothetical protein